MAFQSYRISVKTGKGSLHLGRLRKEAPPNHPFWWDPDSSLMRIELEGRVFEFHYPEMRSVINTGWATPDPDAGEAPSPTSGAAAANPGRATAPPRAPAPAPGPASPPGTIRGMAVEVQRQVPIKGPRADSNDPQATVKMATVSALSGLNVQGPKEFNPAVSLSDQEHDPIPVPKSAALTGSKARAVVDQAPAVEGEDGLMIQGPKPFRATLTVKGEDGGADRVVGEVPKGASEAALRTAGVTVPEENGPMLSDGIVEVLPGIFWDKAVHWKSRAKNAAGLYANKPEVLDAIIAIEAEAVIAEIQRILKAKEKAKSEPAP